MLRWQQATWSLDLDLGGVDQGKVGGFRPALCLEGRWAGEMGSIRGFCDAGTELEPGFQGVHTLKGMEGAGSRTRGWMVLG